MKLCGFFLLTCFFLVSGANADSPTISQLLQEQESSAGLIRRLAADVEIHRRILNGKRLEQQKLVRKAKFAFDSLEDTHLQTTWVEGMKEIPGFVSGCFHIWESGNESRSLVNWDWERSKPLEPAYQGPVRAYIGRREQLLRGAALWPDADFLLFKLHLNNSEKPRRPADMLTQTPELKVDSSSSETYTVSCMHPLHRKSKEFRNMRLNVDFDRSKGSLISRIEGVQVMDDGSSWKMARTVKEFYDLGAGIFVPKLISFSYENTKTGFISTLEETQLLNLRINADVTDDDLELRFPENVLVVDLDVPEGKDPNDVGLIVWGDGEPDREIQDVTELATIQLERDKAKRGSAWTLRIVIVGISAAGLVGILIYYRSRS